MTPKIDLSGVMDRVSVQMIANFQSSTVVEHRGSAGTVREDIVRNFLKNYLPRPATVTASGELLATTGEVSGQCDVMVLAGETPPLWTAESYRVAPIECCYATIEVKSKLTRAELRKAWDAAKRVKSLPRLAYIDEPSIIPVIRTAYGRRVDTMPPQVHVFAYESVSLSVLGEELNSLAQEGDDHSLGIDSVCVLDKGYVTWVSLESGGLGTRLADSKVATYRATPGQVLLYLVAVLNKHLTMATMNPKFDITKYFTSSLGDLDWMWSDFPPDVLSAALEQARASASARQSDR